MNHPNFVATLAYYTGVDHYGLNLGKKTIQQISEKFCYVQKKSASGEGKTGFRLKSGYCKT